MFLFQTASLGTSLAGLKISSLPESWGYRHELPCPAFLWLLQAEVLLSQPFQELKLLVSTNFSEPLTSMLARLHFHFSPESYFVALTVPEFTV